MGAGVGVEGGGQVPVEAVDGHADGANAFLGAVPGSGGVLFLVTVELDEFALGLEFDRSDGVFVLKQGFEEVLAVQDIAHRLGCVQAETALLDSGVAAQGGGSAGVEVENLGNAEVFAVEAGDPGGEVEGVDGFGGRVQEEVGDVIGALLVFEDGVLALEGEFPEAKSLAQRVLGRWCVFR